MYKEIMYATFLRKTWPLSNARACFVVFDYFYMFLYDQ